MDTTGLKQFYYVKRDKQTEDRRLALREDLFHVLKSHARNGATYGDLLAALTYAIASFSVVFDQLVMCWDSQPSNVPDSVGYRMLRLTDRYSLRQPIGMQRPEPDGLPGRTPFSRFTWPRYLDVGVVSAEHEYRCFPVKFPFGCSSIEESKRKQRLLLLERHHGATSADIEIE